MILKDAINEIKKVVWFFIKPLHPYMRDGLLALGLIHHHGRQPHHIGYLAKGKSASDLRQYLLTQKKFEDHFPCWVDDGETVDLRFRQNFDWQYHLRIFNDGEVRGHHEYTPESRPIAHLRDRESTACHKEFMHFLAGWVEAGEHSETLRVSSTTCRHCKKPTYPQP